MKKTICMIAAALVLTFFISGIMVGCDSKTSASAANSGKNTAKKVSNTVSRLETLEDKDFRFPTVFENDFFSDETVTVSCAVYQCNERGCRPMPRQNNFNNNATRNNQRNVEERGYRARHIGGKQLNHEGAQRTKFLDKFDDLYVLCADISAANAKCKDRIEAIGEQTAELKTLSHEMKKSGKKSKEQFAKFNYESKQVDESAAALIRDRNRIKTSTIGRKARESSVDVEAMTVRNLRIMNKVENRLRLLEDLHKDLLRMNECMRLMLEKQETVAPAAEPVAVQAPLPAPRFRNLPYIVSW